MRSIPLEKAKGSENIVIICDEDGLIEEIINQDMIKDESGYMGKPFSAILDKESSGKSMVFMDTMKKKQAAFDHEFFLNTSEGKKMLLFSGINVFQKFLIIGSSTFLSLNKLFEEISRIVNEQTNRIRTLEKKNKQNRGKLREEGLYDQLSSINNELVNTRRELEKKNRELENLNRKLEEIIRTDPLTGLFNRAYFYEKAEEEIDRADRLGYHITIVYIDIDDFKEINDERGHDEGDRVLKEFSRVSLGKLRKGLDSAFRFGGDEFVYLLTNCDEKTAEGIVNRIDSQCHGNLPPFTISRGILCLDRKRDQDIRQFLEESLKSADARMYEHKKSKK